MFIAAVFMIIKLWKQLTFLQLMNAIRMNKIMLFDGKWMQMKNIMLSVLRQSQKDKDHIFYHMWGQKKSSSNIMKNIYTKGNSLTGQGW
jgi:hypothetical protein